MLPVETLGFGWVFCFGPDWVRCTCFVGIVEVVDTVLVANRLAVMERMVSLVSRSVDIEVAEAGSVACIRALGFGFQQVSDIAAVRFHRGR